MNRKTFANFAICFLVFCCFAFFLQQFQKASDVEAFVHPAVTAKEHVQELAHLVVLQEAAVQFGQVNNRVDAHFTVTNNSPADIRNLILYCRMFDDDGQQWSYGTWQFFSTVPAGHTVSMEKVDKRYVSHRAISRETRCEITDYAILQPDLVMSQHYTETAHDGGEKAGGKHE